MFGWESHPFTNFQLKTKYGKSSKAFYVASLELGGVVDPANWNVEHDQANNDCDHVTISPARDLEAVEIADSKNKVGFPLLEQLPWSLNSAEVLILKARAEWREDYYPDSDEWTNCVTVTFNRILAIGGADDFLAVWRIHRMISTDIVGTDAKQDFEKVISFAIAIISSYLDDFDLHDPNDPDTVAYAALEYLHTLQARGMHFRSTEIPQISQSEVKVFNKFGEETSPRFVHENLESFDSQLRIFGLHVAIGSLYAFSSSGGASISDYISNKVVTVEGEDYTVVFVSPFQKILLDEFADLENNRTKARFENHEVVFPRDSLDSLLSLNCHVDMRECEDAEVRDSKAFHNSPNTDTAIVHLAVAVADLADATTPTPPPSSQQQKASSHRAFSSRQCNGKSKQRDGCQNRTCCMYSIDGVEFKPYCWRHKQQILQ